MWSPKCLDLFAMILKNCDSIQYARHYFQTYDESLSKMGHSSLDRIIRVESEYHQRPTKR